MKYLYLLLGLIPVFSWAQNLNPKATTAIDIDIMPKQSTYIGSTKVAFKPVGSADYIFASTFDNELNKRVYTVVENPTQSDLYFTYYHIVTVTQALNTTSKTTERTNKDGSKTNVTTYTSDMTVEILVEVNMFTQDGIKVKSEKEQKRVVYQASSSSRDASRNQTIDNRKKKRTGHNN